RQNVASGAIPLTHKNRVIKNHMSIERALDMLRANDLGQVREIHLLHLSDGNSDAEAFRRQVQELTGKPVYVAQAR
ncbi:MAG: MBL fold metallo-hydrolase, partial [Bacillota bacterium]